MTGKADFYLNWAKERIDEMDAVLASLDGKVAQLSKEARSVAERAIDDLRTKRDAFFEDLQKAGQGE